jgi:hypothetical protein
MGTVFRVPHELFAENSRIQVMLGQGMEPEQHLPVTDLMGDDELARLLDGIRAQVENTVAHCRRATPTSGNIARRRSPARQQDR